jgi:hypothetical protein
MIPAKQGKDYCPDCGGKLLYNGQGMVCIRCPFGTTNSDSSKTLPAIGTGAPDSKERRFPKRDP